MTAITHTQVWNAIDALAARHGMTASGLARRAGLDATAFNKSKRIGADGRLRWPSMETVAKVLLATGDTLADFSALVEPSPTNVASCLALLEAVRYAGTRAVSRAAYPHSCIEDRKLRDLIDVALARVEGR